MILLRLIELLLIVLSVAFVATQILIPVVSGTSLFPIFRSSRSAIAAQIVEANSQVEEKEMREHLAELQTQLKPTEPTK